MTTRMLKLIDEFFHWYLTLYINFTLVPPGFSPALVKTPTSQNGHEFAKLWALQRPHPFDAFWWS